MLKNGILIIPGDIEHNLIPVLLIINNYLSVQRELLAYSLRCDFITIIFGFSILINCFRNFALLPFSLRSTANKDHSLRSLEV